MVQLYQASQKPQAEEERGRIFVHSQDTRDGAGIGRQATELGGNPEMEVRLMKVRHYHFLVTFIIYGAQAGLPHLGQIVGSSGVGQSGSGDRGSLSGWRETFC